MLFYSSLLANKSLFLKIFVQTLMRVPLRGISIVRQRVSTVALNGQTEVILSVAFVMEDVEEKSISAVCVVTERSTLDFYSVHIKAVSIR